MIIKQWDTYHYQGYVQVKPLAEHPNVACEHEVVGNHVKDLTPNLHQKV